jgi:hypothetical protein
MAEVGILIIFVLLLLLSYGELRRVRYLRSIQGKEFVATADIAQLRAAERTLRQVAEELGVALPDSTEDFTRLVLAIRAIAQSTKSASALAKVHDAVADIVAAKHRIERIAALGEGRGPIRLADELEQQGYRLVNQEGQLKLLENRLVIAGHGKGERPCWVRPDGTIDYLYEAVLLSSGIRLRELIPPGREGERALLPAPVVSPTEILSEGDFLARTKPLFDYSKAENCRFFVVVYDGTGSHEKLLYKSRLRAVEGHFYKRLATDAPPF